ncbi:MAG: peptide-methionine (S)-S-oxide reductase MsrA [Verrucomicrobiota bacterium]|nr:peptide-methionine (S)-S-oxide reductase MsrA [Verrucomicrobiota bacterium]
MSTIPNQSAGTPTSTTTPDIPPTKTQLATFGGGCFWCTEAVYQRIPGVLKAVSGYAGGNVVNPSYKAVCSGATGHAEVIQIEYDPSKVTYRNLVDVFWEAHDPTTLNRQGADEGTQYRSIILYRTPEEKKIAEESKAAAQKHFSQPIVTQIVPFVVLYPAENAHQDYYDSNSDQSYCRFVIAPKLKKLEKHFGKKR